MPTVGIERSGKLGAIVIGEAFGEHLDFVEAGRDSPLHPSGTQGSGVADKKARGPRPSSRFAKRNVVEVLFDHPSRV
ncbi:hypothetical protein MesoLj113a_74650 [Mesorhizobium sp. 113-1-2]|nr:Uncharacterized protein MLTONO_5160 [Mesorhizobium loti]BCG76307.1 hypothetical protein MesoLj113a_74650 [Mesorhizobium sp. 113-1-2]BCG97568.1 hypothetical protein MesoLj131a_64320 [Mesorhizobium sp. 131-2-1]BCH04635.1 hypothetical protein MesoLj131b_66340 [Mesorhizobium sp. 131-2-5]BCH12400.1 hypothetical protein MesoLj131c_66580 [Mesorhizobium sp. 131-3-5]BCH19290.1 hypothetical protein MesoLjLa_61410 [Mesorhizobium sp. L-2-11]BCH27160.1 hypothetical protein MesoLjLb_69450 [Mesorhizobium